MKQNNKPSITIMVDKPHSTGHFIKYTLMTSKSASQMRFEFRRDILLTVVQTSVCYILLPVASPLSPTGPQILTSDS